jgi:hypothetical protein
MRICAAKKIHCIKRKELSNHDQPENKIANEQVAYKQRLPHFAILKPPRNG